MADATDLRQEHVAANFANDSSPKEHSAVRDYEFSRNQIDGPQFVAENDDLSRQVAALEEDQRDTHRARDARTGATAAFQRVADLLQDIDIGVLWDEATPGPKPTLVNDLIDSINFHPDQLTVQVVGAPAIKVELDEVGLVAVSNRWCRRPDVTSVQPSTGD